MNKSLLTFILIAAVSILNTSKSLAATDEFADFENEEKTSSELDLNELDVDPFSSKKNNTTKEEVSAYNAVTSQIEMFVNNNKLKQATEYGWKNIDKIDKKGLIVLARTHIKLSQFTEAVRATTLALSKDPKSFETLTLQGEAQFKLLKNKEAIDSLKKAIEINKKYQPAYEVMAEIYQSRKNTYELRILYQDMVETIGPKIDFLTKLCQINTNDGTNDQGLKYCKQAIEVDPSVVDNFVYIGIIYKQQKDTEAAKKQFKLAVTKFPNNEMSQYNLGSFFEEQKNYIDAFNAYEIASRIDPKSFRSWIGLGSTAYQIQKFDVSYKALEKACRLNKKESLVAIRKAAIYMKNNKIYAWDSKFFGLADSCSNLN